MKFTLKNIGALPYDEELGGYVVRFRIVTQDRNRFSAWSNFYVVKLPESMIGSEYLQTAQPDSSATAAYYTTLSAGKYLVTATWSDSESLYGLSEVDVYTRQGSTWVYRGRMPINNASNISQFVFNGAAPFNVRFSFHRPSKEPATGEPPVTSRLFVIDKTIT